MFSVLRFILVLLLLADNLLWWLWHNWRPEAGEMAEVLMMLSGNKLESHSVYSALCLCSSSGDIADMAVQRCCSALLASLP